VCATLVFVCATLVFVCATLVFVCATLVSGSYVTIFGRCGWTGFAVSRTALLARVRSHVTALRSGVCSHLA
jgi:hypothetical protein